MHRQVFDSQNFRLSRADWEFLLDCLCEGLAPAAFERIKPANSQKVFVPQPGQVLPGAAVKFDLSSNYVDSTALKRAALTDTVIACTDSLIAPDFNEFLSGHCSSADGFADGADASAADAADAADASAVLIDDIGLQSLACSDPGRLSLDIHVSTSRGLAFVERPLEVGFGASVRRLVALVRTAACAYIVTRYLHLFS